jgi:hypothetical protein
MAGSLGGGWVFYPRALAAYASEGNIKLRAYLSDDTTMRYEGPIRPTLLRAYRKTCYEVGAAKVRIGQRCLAMDYLLLRHHMREAAFITAYNPLSRPMPPGWNERMQKHLVRALRDRILLPARGYWRQWAETHVVVFGDTRPTRKLARYFRQNGIVIVRRRQPAQLLITF